MAHRLHLLVFLSAVALAGPLGADPRSQMSQVSQASPTPPPPAPQAAQAAPPADKAPEAAVHRVTLSAGAGKDLPYSIEVPRDWTMRQEQGFPGLFVGPPDAKPDDPRMIWVRGSKVAMSDPVQVAANIRASDAQAEDWAAPRLEEREVGGVKALLVRLDTKHGEVTRSTLVLKLPLGEAGLDVLASAEKAELDKRLREYERILLSIRPVAQAAPAPAPAAPPAPKKE
jgi:hypothetical protein